MSTAKRLLLIRYADTALRSYARCRHAKCLSTSFLPLPASWYRSILLKTRPVELRFAAVSGNY